jgi:hypothetical protein
MGSADLSLRGGAMQTIHDANLFCENYLGSFCFAFVRGGEDVEFRRVGRQRALVDVHPPQVDVNSTRAPGKKRENRIWSQTVSAQRKMEAVANTLESHHRSQRGNWICDFHAGQKIPFVPKRMLYVAKRDALRVIWFFLESRFSLQMKSHRPHTRKISLHPTAIVLPSKMTPFERMSVNRAISRDDWLVVQTTVRKKAAEICTVIFIVRASCDKQACAAKSSHSSCHVKENTNKYFNWPTDATSVLPKMPQLFVNANLSSKKQTRECQKAYLFF